MSKKTLFSGLVIAVICVISAILIARPFFASTGPERAFPALPEETPYLLLKAENPELMKKKILSLSALLSTMVPDEMPGAGDGGGLKLSKKFLGLADRLTSFADISKQMALLLPPLDTSHFYLAFYTEPEAFLKFVSNPDQSLYAIERWETGRGSEAWRLEPIFLNFPEEEEPPYLYLLKTSMSGEELVIASENEEGVDRMLQAIKSSASRLPVKRYNDGPDYIQARTPVVVKGSGKTKYGMTEIAWAEDDRSAHAQIYSNLFSLMADKAVPKSGLRGDVPLLGDGEVALVAAMDIPFACFLAYYKANDSIATALDYLNPLLPDRYMRDLRAIAQEGRVSAVVTGKSGATDPNTTYIVIESGAKDAMGRLFGVASAFLTSEQLKGWDEVYAKDFGMGVEPIVARRENIVLIGLGSLADFQKNAIVPDAIKDFAAPKDLVNIAVSSSLWRVGGKNVKDAAKKKLAQYGLNPSAIDGLNVSGGAVQLRVITPERANLGIYWDRQ